MADGVGPDAILRFFVMEALLCVAQFLIEFPGPLQFQAYEEASSFSHLRKSCPHYEVSASCVEIVAQPTL